MPKTKFILMGGYIWKAPDGGKSLYKELIGGFKEPVKVLLCLFARPKQDWPKLYDEDKNNFAENLGNKYELRLASPDDFLEQLRWADVLYVRGGREQSLLDVLKKNEGWKELLLGKTYAGGSAGANIISRYYYGLDELKFREGLGVLPIKVLVHYLSDYNSPNIDWQKAYDELKEYGDKSLPVYALKEGEFVVIGK